MQAGATKRLLFQGGTGRARPNIRLWSKECEVSQLSAALFLDLMFVGFFARLRAEPQCRLPMYDKAELRAAVNAASHDFWSLAFC